MILANGFFVAAEFAVVAVDRSRIEAQAGEGHKAAHSVLKALRTLSFQLSGAQLGITVTSLIVGFITEPTLGEALRPLFDALPFLGETSARGASLATAFLIAIALQMVFGELVPKNLAIANPTRVAYSVATPFRFVNALFKPVIVGLNAAANGVVRLFGVEPRDELEMARSLEELELLIRSSGEEGALLEEEFALLRRAVSFGGKTADDALRPRVAIKALEDDATIRDMNEFALATGYSRFPVFRNDLDDIVGIAHVKDAFAVPAETRDKTPVSAILQEAPIFPETRDLESLLLELRRERKQMGIVVDEYGGTAGIITMEDLIEEIVGEIEDEHDPGEVAARVTIPLAGTHVLSGLLHPDEVEEISGLQIPDGDYETIAGFMLSRLERIPRVGDQIEYQGWELKVVEMDRNRIAEVLVVGPAPEDEEVER
ncbi:MAG: hemolysin family protein [Actinomycetota bacterium]